MGCSTSKDAKRAEDDFVVSKRAIREERPNEREELKEEPATASVADHITEQEEDEKLASYATIDEDDLGDLRRASLPLQESETLQLAEDDDDDDDEGFGTARELEPPPQRSLGDKRPSSGFFPSFRHLEVEMQKLKDEGRLSVVEETSGVHSVLSETFPSTLESVEITNTSAPASGSRSTQSLSFSDDAAAFCEDDASTQDLPRDPEARCTCVRVVGHRIVFSDDRPDEVVRGRDDFLAHIKEKAQVVSGTRQQETMFVEVEGGPVRGLKIIKKTFKGPMGPFNDESVMGDFEEGYAEHPFDENEVPTGMFVHGQYKSEISLLDEDAKLLWRHTIRFEIVKPAKRKAKALQ